MPSRTRDPEQREPQIVVREAEAALEAGAGDPELESADDASLTQESFRAILSSHQRAGRWEPADEIEAHAICGQVTLDFTRAELPASGVVEIEAWAICGEVEIVVPDGAEVEIEGTPFVGSIEQHVRKTKVSERIRAWVTGESDEDRPPPAPPGEPPYFHIDAHAILGSVKVTGR